MSPTKTRTSNNECCCLNFVYLKSTSAARYLNNGPTIRTGTKQTEARNKFALTFFLISIVFCFDFHFFLRHAMLSETCVYVHGLRMPLVLLMYI